MAAINAFARELVLKIVFYGPGLGGKTTTLQYVHDSAKPEHRGKMVSLATAVDRTLYFDFLPLRVPKTRGMNVRLQLFTVPGQVYYNATRKLVLTGCDGIVFVADSQTARHDANLESLENLQENLREQRRELGDVPHVLQYNKRDLANVLSVEELDETLNLYRAPAFPTIATKGDGVIEALTSITRLVVDAFQSTLPSDVPGEDVSTLTLPETGLEGALLGAEPPTSVRTAMVVKENLLDAAAAPRLTGFPEELGEHDEIEPAPPTPAPPTRAMAEGGIATAMTEFALPEAVPAEAPKTSNGASQRPPEAPRPEPRVSTRPRPTFSFSSLWGEGERELVRDAEAAIAAKEHVQAIDLLDALVARVLASGATLLGSSDAPRDAALVPILLGVDGSRYLAFRTIVRDARAGQEPDERAVLAAYAFVLELRLARARIGL